MQCRGKTRGFVYPYLEAESNSTLKIRANLKKNSRLVTPDKEDFFHIFEDVE